MQVTETVHDTIKRSSKKEEIFRLSSGKWDFTLLVDFSKMANFLERIRSEHIKHIFSQGLKPQISFTCSVRTRSKNRVIVEKSQESHHFF